MSSPDVRYFGDTGEISGARVVRARHPLPPDHLSESFFVLSGSVRLVNGDDSGAPASMLILLAPGAPREGYFEGLVEMAASGRQPTDEERAEFFVRHDTYWA